MVYANMPHRAGNGFHSKRLSTAVTWRLTNVVEKYNERKANESSRISVITLPETRPSKESSCGSLEDILNHAVLAEEPTDSYLVLENVYPSIRNLLTDDDIGDGLWICCLCHHENVLRHWKGPYPFKYLLWDRCNRKLCSSCHSSEVLKPWPFGLVSAPQPAPGREVRYCHVCTNCGSTHRAEMEGTTLDFYEVTCAGYGTTSYGDWPGYHIGTVEPYRRYPYSSFVKFIEVRADEALKLAVRW